MTYLGPARIENGRTVLPDGAALPTEAGALEAVEIGGDIPLPASPLDRQRIDRVRAMAAASIADQQEVSQITAWLADHIEPMPAREGDPQ